MQYSHRLMQSYSSVGWIDAKTQRLFKVSLFISLAKIPMNMNHL